MGCGCGGSGTQLGNYVVKDANGNTLKTFTAVTETEVKTFATKNAGSTWRKTS